MEAYEQPEGIELYLDLAAVSAAPEHLVENAQRGLGVTLGSMEGASREARFIKVWRRSKQGGSLRACGLCVPPRCG